MDEQGEEYLHYEESISKTYDGGTKSRRKNQHSARIYANKLNVDRCPVSLYRLYLSKCPTDSRPKQLYLHPLLPNQQKPDLWYARRPVGIHPIENFLRDLTKQVGEVGRYTPHSLRATNATRLFQQGVPEQLIMEQTGHSSLAVRSYKRTTTDLKQTVSKVLQKPPTTKLPLPDIKGDDHDSADDFQPPAPKFPRVSEPKMKKKVPSATVSIPPSSQTKTTFTTRVESTSTRVESTSSALTKVDPLPTTSTTVEKTEEHTVNVPLVNFQVDGTKKTVNVQIQF